MKVYRFNDKRRPWVCVFGHRAFRLHFAAHEVTLENGQRGITGKTPFEALYRAQRVLKQEGKL